MGVKMIKLSNGVEVSEDTVMSALKKAGINVEPKHIFKAGDIAYNESCYSYHCPDSWRLIIKVDGKLHSIDCYGCRQGGGRDYFEKHGYKYAGKLSDLIY